MAYLYIFESGSMVQSSDSPTDVDYEKVEAGVLTIISVGSEGLFEIHDDKDTKEAIDEAVLNDGYGGLGPFHTIC